MKKLIVSLAAIMIGIATVQAAYVSCKSDEDGTCSSATAGKACSATGVCLVSVGNQTCHSSKHKESGD